MAWSEVCWHRDFLAVQDVPGEGPARLVQLWKDRVDVLMAVSVCAGPSAPKVEQCLFTGVPNRRET